MLRRIIGLCSRESGHPEMFEMLGRALSSYKAMNMSWESLVHESETHGTAPLLYKHLEHIGFILPDGNHRILRSLYQRCRFSNNIRNTASAEILDCFKQENIANLVVKGIALANSIYSDPGLRPMRDIDILLRGTDLEKAKLILLDLGYRQQRMADIPDDYYHLQPLVKDIEGLPITIELHHSLLPLDGNYPDWPFAHLYDSSIPFTIGNMDAVTLGLEQNLLYLYQHGLRAPLSYEPFRFIHIADIFCLVERHFANINWHAAQKVFPQLCSILSRLHFVTPWPNEIVTDLALEINRIPRGIGEPYSGWPLVKPADISASRLPLLVRETFWPSSWWTQIYYGRVDGPGYFRVRMLEHPRTLWRWFKGSIRQRNTSAA